MKKFVIINIILLMLFLLAFFFEVIPIPVENVIGAKDETRFIYGGVYWTSGLYQMSVGNITGVISLFCIFGSLLFSNYYFIGKNEKEKQKI